MKKADRIVVLGAHPSRLVGHMGDVVPLVIEGGDAWEDIAEEVDDLILGDGEGMIYTCYICAYMRYSGIGYERERERSPGH